MLNCRHSNKKVQAAFSQGIYTVAQLQILQGVVVALFEYARLCAILSRMRNVLGQRPLDFIAYPSFYRGILKQ